MTTTAGVQHRLRPLAFVAATVGSVTVVLHSWTATAQPHDLLMTGLMLMMSLLCVPCILSVWRRCTAHTVTMLMAMSLGCALLNAYMLVGFNFTVGMDHGGKVARVDARVAGASAHAPLMLAVIALEIATASISAVCVRRFTVPTASGSPQS